MTDDKLAEFEREIARLRENVHTLRERVSSLEGGNTGGRQRTDADGRYDRYDRRVLERVDGDVTNTDPRTLMHHYSVAGVYDEQKQKERTKRLRRLEDEK